MHICSSSLFQLRLIAPVAGGWFGSIYDTEASHGYNPLTAHSLVRAVKQLVHPAFLVAQVLNQLPVRSSLALVLSI